jgi:hypothetical protein
VLEGAKAGGGEGPGKRRERQREQRERTGQVGRDGAEAGGGACDQNNLAFEFYVHNLTLLIFYPVIGLFSGENSESV